MSTQPTAGDRESRLGPPEPGYCHAARCPERSALLVQVYRPFAESWTAGIDYCEPHAHEFARRVEMSTRVVPL